MPVRGRTEAPTLNEEWQNPPQFWILRRYKAPNRKNRQLADIRAGRFPCRSGPAILQRCPPGFLSFRARVPRSVAFELGVRPQCTCSTLCKQAAQKPRFAVQPFESFELCHPSRDVLNCFDCDAAGLTNLLCNLNHCVMAVNRPFCCHNRAGSQREEHSILLLVEVNYDLVRCHAGAS